MAAPVGRGYTFYNSELSAWPALVHAARGLWEEIDTEIAGP